jgi:lipopolysaccharide biosynthesis regulator YciM
VEFEVWWLVFIPVFFFLGWFAARLDLKQLLQETGGVPDSYFKSITFLLNEERDKAIDSFIALAKEDQDSVELQFMVAFFFRQKGELQRAIAIHKGLLDRLDLSSEQRMRATCEIGVDYYKAGFFDRAEHSLKGVTSGKHKGKALEVLESLYVHEKDWERAIICARERSDFPGASRVKNMSHYYCEMGDIEYQNGNYDKSRKHYDEALKHHHNSVRAILGLGNVAVQTQSIQDAIDIWQTIDVKDPRYNALILERLVSSYLDLGRSKEFLELVEKYLQRSPNPMLVELALKIPEIKKYGANSVYDVVRSELKKSKELVWARFLIDNIEISSEFTESLWQDLQLIKQSLVAYSESMMHRCVECGYKAKGHYWQCPACSQWQTFSPSKLTLDGKQND